MLNWLTIRSPPAAPANVPPVIVEILVPTVGVTRMPPEVMILVPERVITSAALVLNCKLLVVDDAASAWSAR